MDLNYILRLIVPDDAIATPAYSGNYMNKTNAEHLKASAPDDKTRALLL